MRALESPDIDHLRSAVGWLELGNYLEADAELDEIAPRLRAHPDVLKVRWRVYAQAKKWDVCLEIARTVTELEPQQPGGWIDYAQSLHRVDRTQESYNVLSSVANRFPEHPTVFYHLVVYGCHLRKLREAWSWLERAFTCPNTSQATITQLFDYFGHRTYKQKVPVGASVDRNVPVVALYGPEFIQARQGGANSILANTELLRRVAAIELQPIPFELFPGYALVVLGSFTWPIPVNNVRQDRDGQPVRQATPVENSLKPAIRDEVADELVFQLADGIHYGMSSFQPVEWIFHGECFMGEDALTAWPGRNEEEEETADPAVRDHGERKVSVLSLSSFLSRALARRPDAQPPAFNYRTEKLFCTPGFFRRNTTRAFLFLHPRSIADQSRIPLFEFVK